MRILLNSYVLIAYKIPENGVVCKSSRMLQYSLEHNILEKLPVNKRNMDKLDHTQITADTVVGPSVKIQGDLNSEGNIKIDGQVTGKVKTTQNVFVGDSAHIAADIIAGTCTVAGEVQGNLKITSNLILLGTARVTGDITCAVLRVEDGAVYTGKCNMTGSEKTGKNLPEPEPEN
jgi:cytoskeletal protein CcmA (bactofilin family)